MNAAQFQAFMATINENQQALIEKLLARPATSNEQNVSNKSVINISHIPTFENYDPKQENFKLYKQRFENYLKLKNLIQDKQKCEEMLLNSIGASTYKILSALISPSNPADLDYDQLISKLENQLCPKRSVLVSQHYFLSTYQDDDSTITDFVTKLRKDLADCDFNTSCACRKQVSAADLFLRAQFIRGLKDTWIKEHILQSDFKNFDEIVSKAIALEASKADSQRLSSTNYQPSNQPSINFLDHHQIINKIQNKKRKSRKDYYNSKFQKPNTPRSKSNSRHSSWYLNFKELGVDNRCLRCGRDGHLANECGTPSSKLRCSHCKKSGHVGGVCIRTLLNSNRSPSPNRVTTVRDHYDDQGINKIIDIYDQPNACGDPSANKYFTLVKIEDNLQKFEVDTGTGYTLIPESQFKNLKITKPLQATHIAFRSYTGDVFLPLGKLRVKVEYNGVINQEDLYVVPDGYKPLLGRVWVRHLKINLAEIDQVNSTSLDFRSDAITNKKRVMFGEPIIEAYDHHGQHQHPAASSQPLPDRQHLPGSVRPGSHQRELDQEHQPSPVQATAQNLPSRPTRDGRPPPYLRDYSS